MSWNQAAIDAAPNSVSTVPGAQVAFNRLMAIVNASANLPPGFTQAVSDQVARGEKVIYYINTQRINGNGANTLEAMARVIEEIAHVRIYVHFFLKESRYRVGPILDSEDVKEVRGALVLGREKDGFTDDVNGDFFRGNGVPANFSTAPGVPDSVPRTPTYPVVPFRNTSGKVVKTSVKPRNSWILYRVSRHAAVKKANPDLHTSAISAIIKHEWVTMDAQVKTLWNELARNEKLLHKQHYPSYRLQPRKSEDIKRRRSRKADTGAAVDVIETSNSV